MKLSVQAIFVLLHKLEKLSLNTVAFHTGVFIGRKLDRLLFSFEFICVF